MKDKTVSHGLCKATCYNGRGIGPGSVFGKLLAGYALNGSKKDIPLPIKTPKNVFLGGLRGFFYETGTRAYHVLQRQLL